MVVRRVSRESVGAGGRRDRGAHVRCTSRMESESDLPKRYTNLVTERSQRNTPPESRGGLLADQMGLGKSLTMISLIAANPADSKASVIYTSQGTIRRIKSTLVVVPYSRKFITQD
jgi:hypothetical protein